MAPKSLDDVDIVLNPGAEVFQKNLRQIHSTEGWPFTDADYDIWRTTFQGFWFYAAIEKDTNRPVGSVLLALDEASTDNDKLYSIGFYYCHPDWRGTGLGSCLFNKIMAIAGENNTALNGVPRMTPLYAKKYGFDKMPPWRHMFGKFLAKNFTPLEVDDSFTVKDINEVAWDDVLAYDSTICSRPRGKFLKKFTEPRPDVHTKVVLNSDAKIVGLVSARKDVGNDLVLGPFYAENQAAASALVNETLKVIDLSTYNYVACQYPQVNKDCESLLIKISNGTAILTLDTQLAFTKRTIDQPALRVFGMSESAASFV